MPFEYAVLTAMPALCGRRETQSWMLGGPDAPTRAPAFLRGGSAIVWARAFSASDERRCDCETLHSVLQVRAPAEREGPWVPMRGLPHAIRNDDTGPGGACVTRCPPRAGEPRTWCCRHWQGILNQENASGRIPAIAPHRR